MIDHRRPPDPPFLRTREKICHVCGGARPARRTRYCSDACSDVMDYVWHSRWALWMIARDMFGDDPACCFECRQRAPLVLDHIRPLWSLSASERCEMKWWLPFNQQLLCVPCHNAKTAREAAERAREKRIAMNVALFRKTGFTEDEIAEWTHKVRGPQPDQLTLA